MFFILLVQNKREAEKTDDTNSLKSKIKNIKNKL